MAGTGEELPATTHSETFSKFERRELESRWQLRHNLKRLLNVKCKIPYIYMYVM